jgi:glycerol-3-phosphate dehydrogenase
VEDSRLVVLNAQDAAERGARVHVHTRLLGASVEGGRWVARCERADGAPLTLRARALVNATGAWVNEVVARCGLAPRTHVRLVKGSHLVFPRLYDGDHAYLLQNPDRRVVFLIPYERDFTLLGTTDVPFDGDASKPRLSEDEARYLCDCANRFLRRTLQPEDAVGEYSGVRPLHDDGSAALAQQVSRDYRLEVQTEAGAPLLSVYGGKITTYRRLAEHALSLLLPALEREPGDEWTAMTPLPGGDIANGDLPRFTRESCARWPGVDAALVGRLARTYGTRLARILGGASDTAGLGADLGQGLTERELEYLVAAEWARTPDDVLLRRTRLGLRDVDGALARALAGYFSTKARSMT